MEGIIHDLRFGVRTLWRNPGFTLVAMVTLALGIGINVAMLSVAWSALFRDLPFPEPDRLLVLWRDRPGGLSRGPLSIPTFRDWRDRDRSFDHMAMFLSSNQNLIGGDGEPARVAGLLVSSELPATLGIRPILGRSFEARDDRLAAERTVMLSHDLWSRRFGADPAIVGKSVDVDGDTYTVIGILPSDVGEERIGRAPIGDLWLPIGLFFDRLPVEKRAERVIGGVGRLKPGVDVEAAREDMARISRELAEEYSETYSNSRLTGVSLHEDQVREVRPALRLLLVFVGFVLVIVCSNLINLVLTRNATRGQELATRGALGAGSGRLLRLLTVENLILALLGGGLGFLASRFFLGLLSRLAGPLAKVEVTGTEAPVIVTTLVSCLVIGLIAGLVPAIYTFGNQKRGLGGSLSTRNPMPRQGLRKALVVGELALALVLIVGAGLMRTSLVRLQAQDPGFSVDRVLSLKVVVPQAKFEQRFGWMAFFDNSLEQLRQLADVEHAAVTSLRPLEGEIARSIVAAGDRELPRNPDMPLSMYVMVSPGYFSTMGIPLLEGRDFSAADDDRSDAERVAVISESLARLFWSGESALGKRIAFEFQGTPEAPEPQWREVVGVVGDVRLESLRKPTELAVYAPYTQLPLWFQDESPMMALMLKSRTDPEAIVQSARARLFDLDPHQPLFSIHSMAEIFDQEIGSARAISWLLASFAGLALVLAMVGVYGVVSLNVTQRTREIGTRMALGARPLDILSLVCRQGMSLIGIGIGLGLGAAWLLTGLMSGLLYEVEAADMATYVAAAALLAAVALLATLIPSLGAMRVEPAEALRWE